jgi:hypothetical protein
MWYRLKPAFPIPSAGGWKKVSPASTFTSFDLLPNAFSQTHAGSFHPKNYVAGSYYTHTARLSSSALHLPKIRTSAYSGIHPGSCH